MTCSLTFAEIQAYLKRLVGTQQGSDVCISACVEFGADGRGILRTAWQLSGHERDEMDYEFESATELAMLMRLGRIPRRSYQ